MNNTALNMKGANISSTAWFHFLWNIHKSRIGRFIFNFCAASLLFSILGTPIYNSTGFVAQGSLFSTSWPALVNLLSFLIVAILTGVKVIPHCEFDLHFPDD